MNILVRTDNEQYLITATFKDTGEFTEDGLAEVQKEFKNFCIFHEDKGLYDFTKAILDKWLNIWELTVVNKTRNYGIKWEKVTT